MKEKANEEMQIQAVVYQELINDTQARIFEFEKAYPDCVTDEIRDINRRLSDARMQSRVYVDVEHFRKWEGLIQAAKAAMEMAIFNQVVNASDEEVSLASETLMEKNRIAYRKLAE